MTTRVLALLELPAPALLVADVLAAAVRYFPDATVVPSVDGRQLSIHVVTVDDADPLARGERSPFPGDDTVCDPR